MKKEKNKNSKTIFKEFRKLHITDETKTCGENQPKSGIFFPFKVTKYNRLSSFFSFMFFS